MQLAEWLVRPFVRGIEWDWLNGSYDLLLETLNGIGWLARTTFCHRHEMGLAEWLL